MSAVAVWAWPARATDASREVCDPPLCGADVLQRRCLSRCFRHPLPVGLFAPTPELELDADVLHLGLLVHVVRGCKVFDRKS